MKDLLKTMIRLNTLRYVYVSQRYAWDAAYKKKDVIFPFNICHTVSFALYKHLTWVNSSD